MAAPRARTRQHGRCGGSAGAGAAVPGLDLVHQTGERDLEAVRQGYERAGIAARTAAFLDPVVDEVTRRMS